MDRVIAFRIFGIAAILSLMLAIAGTGARADTSARLDELFEALQGAEPAEARKIAREIELEFSKSGSATMDLLFKRGRDALEAGELERAIGHLTALTDHAPEFAEGFFMRAAAFVRAERFGPALADLERTLALNPRHFEAIGALGFLLQEMDRPEMARDAYLQVLDIHPHHERVTTALERLAPELTGKDL